MERCAVVVVAAVLVVAGAGPGILPAGLSAPDGGVGIASATAAGVTASVEPNRTSVDAGNATTFDVVIRGADRGVGSYEVTVNSSDASIAGVEAATAEVGTITDTDVAADGSGAKISGADGSATGPTVTVATVTVRGEANGTVSLSVSVGTVADPNDDPYAVDGTDPAALEVLGTAVALDLTTNRTRVARGEPVGFTVRRNDTGTPVNATVAAGGRSEPTGEDGSVAFRFDANGTYTATASRPGEFLNDSVEVTVGSGRVSVDVSLEPRVAAVEAGNRTQFDVVVDGFDDGIGTYEVVVNTSDAAVAPVVDATKRVDGAFGLDPTVAGNGTGARLRGLQTDTAQTGPVVLGSVTLRGDAVGSVGITVTRSLLANESQTRYHVGTVTNATLAVERRLVPLAVTLDPGTVEPGAPVVATVTRTDTGERVNATVRANGTIKTTGGDGRVSLRFGAAGNYTLTATRGDTATETYASATATVRVETAGPGRDLDGDGRYEDVDADGDFDIVDVAVLLASFEEKRAAGYVDRFDFRPDGRLNILDVTALLNRT